AASSTTTAGKIVSATSVDGLTWTLDAGTRLTGTVSDARIQKLPDGSYRLFYTSVDPASPPTLGRILSAVSADGLTWTTEPGVRLDRGPPGSFDSSQVRGVNFTALPDGTFRLYYTGTDSAGNQRILS